MKKIHFSIVGAGWRSNYFFKLAKELPDLFSVSGVVVRDEKKALHIKETWGFPVANDINNLKNTGEFIVLCLPQNVMPSFIQDCNKKEYYVLAETFEMNNVQALNDFYASIEKPELVQIAEQYTLQPMHHARLNLIKKGEIGDIQQAIISSGHGYHGTSLIRNYLGKTFENCTVRGKIFNGKVIKGPGRNGYPEKEELVTENQVIATLDFGDSIGMHYFTSEQYFSKIRKPNILIRGTHGEIQNDTVRSLIDFKTPIEYPLIRETQGFNEFPSSYGLIGITGAKDWVYKNAYVKTSISDDEIAVATELEKMAVYVRGGKVFYSLEEGLQDQYLSLLIKESITTNTDIDSKTQSFAK